MGDTATSWKPAARIASLKTHPPKPHTQRKQSQDRQRPPVWQVLVSALSYSLAVAQKQISCFTPSQVQMGEWEPRRSRALLLRLERLRTATPATDLGRVWVQLPEWLGFWVRMHKLFCVFFHTLLWQGGEQRRARGHLGFCALGAWQLPPSHSWLTGGADFPVLLQLRCSPSPPQKSP